MLAGIVAISPAMQAQNANYEVGDLVLFFQKPGSENTVYVGLGNAATLYRGSAVGPTADRQALNIVNIASSLESAFGADWEQDPEIFAGLAASWSSSPNIAEQLNGDPHRTLYASQARQPLGAPGTNSSEPWDFTLSGFAQPSSSIFAMNNKLETDFTTRVGISPVSSSTIDDNNLIQTSPTGGFLQPSSFGAFPGGVQQQGTEATLGAFGPARQVEFALDLYRILPRITAEGQVTGPLQTGSYEGTVVVSTAGNVSFITQPYVPAPEIDVEQPEGSPLADGGSASFPATTIGQASASKTFLIENNGDAPLTGLALSITGSNTGDFAFSTLTKTSLAIGEPTSFTVIFDPQAVGARSATLQIASNDADENPYDILFGGMGNAAAPEISVLDPASVVLVDGAAEVASASTAVGSSSVSKNFTIQNLGNASLTGLAILKSGSHAADFTVTSLTRSSVAAGSTTTFKVTFMPTAKGARNASLQITSNDADENPFDIELSGTAFTPVPEIDIQQKTGSSLVDGSTRSISFGTVAKDKSGTPKSFTIFNKGSANLTGLAVSFSGGDSKDFIVTKPATTVAPGKSTTFKVTFKPSAIGTLKATIRVKSNDANENPFDIRLTGMGAKK